MGKVDYEDCLVNLSSSILKEFGVQPKHSTLKDVDEILAKKDWKKIVVMLYDGLGSSILEKHLSEDSFLRSHKKRDFSSVFPATTVASTTSFLSGLEPCEHCWLGWEMYFKEHDEIVTLFLNTLKDSTIKATKKTREYEDMNYKSILDRINEETSYSAYYAWPFDAENPCPTLKDVHERVEKLCKEDGKKFIYAYCENPDAIMHETGIDSVQTKNVIDELERETARLCSRLEDTLVIVVADHGHVKNKFLTLTDYPEIYGMLQRMISIETRAFAIYIKDDVEHEFFEEKFNEVLGDKFELVKKDDVISRKMFGSGIPSERFESYIGDYLAVAKGDFCMRDNKNGPIFMSIHGGDSEEEVKIPVIIIETV